MDYQEENYSFPFVWPHECIHLYLVQVGLITGGDYNEGAGKVDICLLYINSISSHQGTHISQLSTVQEIPVSFPQVLIGIHLASFLGNRGDCDGWKSSILEGAVFHIR